MGIDIICLIFYALGIYKGFSKGLLAAVLTLLGYLLALVFAIKFGSELALFLKDLIGISGVWGPAVSFLIIFIIVLLLVKMLINVLNKGLEVVMMGWLNKLGGVIFYFTIYSLILIIIFYWLSFFPFSEKDMLKNSFSYNILHNKMPLLIRFFGGVWPSLKVALSDMEHLLH